MQTSTQVGQTKTYPLGALVASTRNVRKKKRSPDTIKAMALSIHAHGGLLQNLVVIPEVKNGKQTGRAEVIAGETRRLGLCLLRDGGIEDASGFTDDFPVPVLEVSEEEATAASATENIQREQMHPADQFEAFRELLDQCGSVEHVAAVFGVTPLVVRQRLKLANASPKLLDLYRHVGMTLEQLMALSITDDHDAQERVWESGKGREWERSPSKLREALTAKELPTDSVLVRFVGLKAYEKAGGQVRHDLFAHESAGYIIDVGLLNELATDKLEDVAEAVRAEGWKWVQVRPEAVSGYQLVDFGHAPKTRRVLTADEQAALDAAEAHFEAADKALDALYDNDSDNDDQIDAAQDRLAEIREKLNDLQEAAKGYAPEVLALAGALVALDRNGEVLVHRGLVKDEDKKALAKATAPKSSTSGEAGQFDGASPSPAAAPKSGFSEALTRRLTAHRTIALQRVLADNTQVALAALAHTLVQRLLEGHRPLTALDLDAKACDAELARCGEAPIAECRAWTELQEVRHQWGERMPGDPDKLLPWLIALPQSELCDLLALCSALTVNAVTLNPRHPADALAEAVSLDMAEWWEPTAESYFAHVPKARILEAVTEIEGSQAAAGLADLKKDALVRKAQEIASGKGWVPAIFKPKAQD